jgi:hypothetical protein
LNWLRIGSSGELWDNCTGFKDYISSRKFWGNSATNSFSRILFYGLLTEKHSSTQSLYFQSHTLFSQANLNASDFMGSRLKRSAWNCNWDIHSLSTRSNL